MATTTLGNQRDTRAYTAFYWIAAFVVFAAIVIFLALRAGTGTSGGPSSGVAPLQDTTDIRAPAADTGRNVDVNGVGTGSTNMSTDSAPANVDRRARPEPTNTDLGTTPTTNVAPNTGTGSGTGEVNSNQ